MQVNIEANKMVAEMIGVVEGVTCIVVSCEDYDHYKQLPHVVSYNGTLCGKTGWNSDTNRAYYQSNAHILIDVSKCK
jgi:hypothetical protein